MIRRWSTRLRGFARRSSAVRRPGAAASRPPLFCARLLGGVDAAAPRFPFRNSRSFEDRDDFRHHLIEQRVPDFLYFLSAARFQVERARLIAANDSRCLEAR